MATFLYSGLLDIPFGHCRFDCRLRFFPDLLMNRFGGDLLRGLRFVGFLERLRVGQRLYINFLELELLVLFEFLKDANTHEMVVDFD